MIKTVCRIVKVNYPFKFPWYFRGIIAWVGAAQSGGHQICCRSDMPTAPWLKTAPRAFLFLNRFFA
jgi:hypothetical protein